MLTACETDAVVGLRFLRVSFLVDPPTRLFHPSFIYRVAAANRRRRQRDSQPKKPAAVNERSTPLPDLLSEQSRNMPCCGSG